MTHLINSNSNLWKIAAEMAAKEGVPVTKMYFGATSKDEAAGLMEGDFVIAENLDEAKEKFAAKSIKVIGMRGFLPPDMNLEEIFAYVTK